MKKVDLSQLEKPYESKTYEKNIYKRWEESGYFNPDNLPERHQQPFSIALPPPNVTGTLHCGHATMLAIQDTVVRFKRMQGYKTLWLPGTDHASIATQSKVEKEISKKEDKSRYDIGREELLRRVNQFAQESHDTIVNQCRDMGSSLDWSREAFTLDEKRNKAVYRAFKEMYDLGLIYRGNRVINWDPKGQTTISDDEIVYEEREATLYTFKYSHDFPIAISTTRPETKFGDTAVAVHPDDERYVDFIGKTYVVNFCGQNLNIKVIADRGVEKDFGTGALGVTPAHSKIDEEMAKANDLPLIQVIDEKGKMTAGGEDIIGKKTAEAREIVAQKIRDAGLMIEEKKITQNVSTAERTGGIIEPLPKLQWFVAVTKEFPFPHEAKTIATKGEMVTLKTLMLRAVESKATEILPSNFERTYRHWIENLRDWCISRQIWYGHRIPVWYKDGEIYCGTQAPEGSDWQQDEDTLDTWFSSGTWSFSTLGWPEQTPDLNTYHPNDLLETGRDILFFWVARMILMSTLLLGEVPFKTVYLHGMALGKDGKKMSKSSGTGIEPLEVTEKFGTDALRMALIVGNAPGNDFRLYDDKIKAYKHFANKIWNASRFVLSNTQEADLDEGLLNSKDKDTLSTWRSLCKEITQDIEKYNLYLAGEKLYSYFWGTFADVLIEESKPRFLSSDETDKKSAQILMLILLKEQLVALHPFMPFVTESIWEILFGSDKENLLMIHPWPIL